MVRPDVVSRKLERATSWLDEAAVLQASEAEPDSKIRRDQDLAAFYIFLAIQECIDLATHWVADAGWPVPEDAGGTFDRLAEQGEIDRELAERMRGAVGLRNRIGHGYAAIDHDRLRAEFAEGTDTLRRFLSAVADEAGL